MNKHIDLTDVLNVNQSDREWIRILFKEGSNRQLYSDAFEKSMAVACDPRVTVGVRLSRIRKLKRSLEILERTLDDETPMFTGSKH